MADASGLSEQRGGKELAKYLYIRSLFSLSIQAFGISPLNF